MCVLHISLFRKFKFQIPTFFFCFNLRVKIDKLMKLLQKKAQKMPTKLSASEDEEDLVSETSEGVAMSEDENGAEEPEPEEVSGEEGESEEDKPAKKLKTAYQEPTADELYDLKNTENLYHSNLLRLQVGFSQTQQLFHIFLILGPSFNSLMSS